MKTIHYNDITVEYNLRDIFPRTAFFHQDFHPLEVNNAFKTSCWLNHSENNFGKSEIESPNVERYFNDNLMRESPPAFPDNFILNCKGKFIHFENSPVLYCPCFARQGLVITKHLYDELNINFVLGPHLTYSVQIINKHKIFNHFVLILFWHHGADLIDWKKSLFIDRNDYSPNYSNLDISKVFQFKSYDEYMKRMNGIRAFSPLSLSLHCTYDIFFSVAAKANILASDRLQKWIKLQSNLSEYFFFLLGRDFEIKSISNSSSKL